MRVLLVEDDQTIGDFVEKGLREAGFAVDRAHDGTAGRDLALAESFDAAIVDVMSVEPVTPDLADQAGVPRMTQGVIITDLDPDGVAANSGLQEGDVIVKVDGRQVKTVEELRSALDRQDKKPALLLVARKGGNFFVTLRQQ